MKPSGLVPAEASDVDILPKMMRKNGLTRGEGAGWDKAFDGDSKKSAVRECQGLAARQGGGQSWATTALVVPSFCRRGVNASTEPKCKSLILP